MASAAKLDRKAKGAVAAVVLVFIAIIGLTLRNSIVAMSSDPAIAAGAPENSDDILVIGGHTVLLGHGSAGKKLAHWLHAESKDSYAFEVGDQAFTPNSAKLTGEGAQRVDRFAQMMNAVTELKARILESSQGPNPQLTNARAGELRSNLLSRGVAPSRVALSEEPISGGGSLSKEPEMVVVLSK
jgi:hypothetical protein